MSVPGGNLLRMAARLIRFETVAHHRFWKNEKVHGGTINPKYYAPAPIKASVQAVSRTMIEMAGLDVQRDYRMVYTQTVLQDVKRAESPDMLDYAGRRYVVESNTDWSNADGWMGSIVVDSGPVPA